MESFWTVLKGATTVPTESVVVHKEEYDRICKNRELLLEFYKSHKEDSKKLEDLKNKIEEIKTKLTIMSKNTEYDPLYKFGVQDSLNLINEYLGDNN